MISAIHFHNAHCHRQSHVALSKVGCTPPFHLLIEPGYHTAFVNAMRLVTTLHFDCPVVPLVKMYASTLSVVVATSS